MSPLTDLSTLDQFAAEPFPPEWPTDVRTFYSPVDDVHGVLMAVISSASESIDVAMYGFDDASLVAALVAAMKDPAITVRLTLDRSQASGAHEKELLAAAGLTTTDISVGTSEKGGIMHLKAGVIDGTVLFDGSTNWSDSGEDQQDNQLRVAVSPVECARLSSRIDTIHAYQLAHPKGTP